MTDTVVWLVIPLGGSGLSEGFQAVLKEIRGGENKHTSVIL